MHSGDKAGWSRWLPGAATVLSMAACYGTLALIALLGSMGIVIAVNDTIWAGAIVAFALLAVIGIAIGLRVHGKAWPLLLGASAAGIVTYTMFINYDRSVELAGFALLCAAVAWDWLLRRRGKA
ncbi:MAG: MerC domain-containing protein [Alphaproteobacteria bacterium]|nr:MerC domain-containing protein [Alphaproteobacteria bacterium]